MLAISLSEDQFLNVRISKDEKAIAIRIYSQPHEVKQTSKGFEEQFVGTLVSYFTDIDEVIEQDGLTYAPFSEDNLEEILRFVAVHQNVDTIYVHCAAGVCRSPGVVEGLALLNDAITVQHGPRNRRNAVYPFPNVLARFQAVKALGM